ncbi:hypothetical protein P9D34_21440 [Bacillus swezeyi]|uniref:Uncharacterized protein n=1 Tax=Bacillus swezeyi TaxID=1925020 RepID=A0A1R1QJD7_9BACI|nr:hypothetical protein [Bacillus swezeyi]MEC1262943.1 hypothetical protein [Bacillus swezeyi]MED1739983.1 hypothetical protein [Bacillus swezeyi]MED2928198.1 hypothetical protein [Bacillus swezeyi]MED2940907.1 hypothetical protein [Bacillus swezeyi]MED2966313.1 hypothetical protein [Bacillus swezeyi]
MAEQHGSEKPFSASNANQQDQETAQVIEKINSLVTGFGQSIYGLVQEKSGIDLTEADFSNNKNAELNQSIQNIINEYIQNINSLNAELNGKIGDSITGTVTSKNKDA